MKLISTLAVASVGAALASKSQENLTRSPVSDIAPGNNISPESVGTSLFDAQESFISTNGSGSTSIVPRGTKTYVAGLRATAGGNNYCSASLITPTHLLVGTYCVSGNIRWASIGSHFVNGTGDGEQIKVIAILNHPRTTGFSNDFAILQLQKPSSFQPVALASSDDSDVYDGREATKMGWDDTGGADTMAYELMRQDVQLMSNANCMKETNVDESMLCSSGSVNETSCTGDYGGPVVVERPNGDVVVGLVSWGGDCGKPGYPSIYSRVSSARTWIESVASGVCFH
ncbi:hypothetical protein V7S43_010336 [Phytophthora oleae]|uniref:Peptidase S1 domain-containing protein n=1 Tax=Phytophthora oleae TaxID=2107226 RepID=A0ABD3FFW0_9STRA